jgi:hypothetical protein
MVDSDDDSISSIDGLDYEHGQGYEQAQTKSPDTKTLPVLAFSSLLLKKKISELSDISNTYNLYLINKKENTSGEWNLYLFVKDPSGEQQPIELSNNNIFRPIVTITESTQNPRNYSSTEYLLEQLLYTTINDKSKIDSFTFHLKPNVKDNIQGLLDRFTIQASSKTIQDFNLSLGIVKSLNLDTSEEYTSNTEIQDARPDPRFVNALKKVLTPDQQSQLFQDEYKYFTNRAGNDCFFLSLAQAYVKSENENLKNQLKERMNLSNSTDINALQKKIRNFIARNVTEEQYKAFKARKGDTINEQMRNRVNSLQDYQDEIKTSAYQADELTIAILLKNYIFPFSVELNIDNENAIVKCTSYLDKPSLQELDNESIQDISQNMIYFMLRYTPSTDRDSNHYELVAYKTDETDQGLKTLFLYNQLPDPIRTLVKEKCKRPDQSNAQT